jgi:hypothetical protein
MKKMAKDRIVEAIFSAFSCPYTYLELGGRLIIDDVNRITVEVTTSVAESSPSLNTAILPDKNPTITFSKDKTAFPITLIHEVRRKIFFLSFIKDSKEMRPQI